MFKLSRPLYLVISCLIALSVLTYLFHTYLTIRAQQNINTISNELLSDLYHARQLAMKLNKTIHVCARNKEQCHEKEGRHWNGWLVFITKNHHDRPLLPRAACKPHPTEHTDCILQKNEQPIYGGKIHVEANITHFSFNKDGVLNSDHDGLLFEICSPQRKNGLQEKALRISNIGHITLISDHHCSRNL